MTAKCIFFIIFFGPKMKSVILKQACGGFFHKIGNQRSLFSWLKNEQVKVCFFTLESLYPYFCCNLRHNMMPYMYSEMQNKLSKTRESPLESMGQIISSRCPIPIVQVSSPWEVLLDKLVFLSFFFHSLPLSEERNMYSE